MTLVRQIVTVTDASNCNSGTARNYGKLSIASDISEAMCTNDSVSTVNYLDGICRVFDHAA